MTRRRWIADRVTGDRAFLTGNNAVHLARVLRVRIGQEFEISTGVDVRLGRVVSIADDSVEFELGELFDQAHIAPIILFLAVFKFDRMEWAIEKATELGVAAIVPVLCRRTDAHLVSSAAKRVERWRRIAHEAAQQSRRVAPPDVAAPAKLNEAIAHATGELKIVLSENEKNLSLKDALSQPTTSDQRPATTLAVGPEGGWTSEELAAFAQAGWTAASLGPKILRAETAAVAALAIVSAFA